MVTQHYHPHMVQTSLILAWSNCSLHMVTLPLSSSYWHYQSDMVTCSNTRELDLKTVYLNWKLNVYHRLTSSPGWKETLGKLHKKTIKSYTNLQPKMDNISVCSIDSKSDQCIIMDLFCIYTSHMVCTMNVLLLKHSMKIFNYVILGASLRNSWRGSQLCFEILFSVSSDSSHQLIMENTDVRYRQLEHLFLKQDHDDCLKYKVS